MPAENPNLADSSAVLPVAQSGVAAPSEGVDPVVGTDADEEWFQTGERSSSVPPMSSRRPSTPSSAPPADPIGDELADVWFR